MFQASNKVSANSRQMRGNVRTVSISTTVLNPFSDSPERGARKLPAAPINQSAQINSRLSRQREIGRPGLTANDEINPSKLLNGLPRRLLQLIRLSYVRLGRNTGVPRSLRQLFSGLSDSVQPAYTVNRINTSRTRGCGVSGGSTDFLPTIVALAPCFIYGPERSF